MSEVFDGTVDVQDGAGTTTVQLDGTQGDATVGGGGQDGAVRILDAAGGLRIALDGTSNTLSIFGATGDPMVEIRQNGDIAIFQNVGGTNREAFLFDASAAALRLGAQGSGGDLRVQDASDREAILIAGANAALYVGTRGNEGDIIVRDDAARDVFHMDGQNAALYIGASGNEGDIRVRDSAGRDVFQVDGNSAAVYIGADGNEGDLIIRDGSGRDVFHFTADFALMEVGTTGNEGDIRVRDDAGNVRIHLDGGAGDIRLHGADCAEHFDVTDAADVDEGTVLVIDESGSLRRSTAAYDRCVAGVVSGAGGYRPGILLDSFADTPDRRPIALAGKVYCKCDASYGPIGVGDLLTTSDTPGYAMRVGEPQRAFGGVLGKALAPLRSGRGLVPILVTLQ